jgi:hypothetical protein
MDQQKDPVDRVEPDAALAVVVNQRPRDFLEFQLWLGELEAAMLGTPQVTCPVRHEFADGVYARIMAAPAGTLVLGKRHRYRTFNVLLSGEVTVYAGASQPVRRLTAGATFTSDALTRKLLFFHKDSEFMNIHPTTARDEDEIENQFIIPEQEFLARLESSGGEDRLWLG